VTGFEFAQRDLSLDLWMDRQARTEHFRRLGPGLRELIRSTPLAEILESATDQDVIDNSAEQDFMAASMKTRKPTCRGNGPSAAKLDQMTEAAIVDAYGESEQMLGFYTMLEDNLALPFKTEMLGVEVTVERIDLRDDDQIVAVCPRGKAKQRVPLLDLPLPGPAPSGADCGSWRFDAGQGAAGNHVRRAGHHRPRQATRGHSRAGSRLRLLHAGRGHRPLAGPPRSSAPPSTSSSVCWTTSTRATTT